MTTKLPSKEGLIFDLDGTLADTLPDIATSINLTRESFNLPQLPEGEITCHVGNGTEHLVRQTVPVPEAMFSDAHQSYAANYLEHMLDQSRLHDGVAAILERFRERSLAVITNKPLFQTEKLLAALDVRPLFRTVLGGDSLPEKKPHPMPIHHFMKSQGLTPERVVMIGDGINDVRAGKAAGVMTVAVTFGVATREELQGEGPDFIIDRMADLAEIIG